MEKCEYINRMSSCVVCGNDSWTTVHKGTRDRSDIDVIKCNKCGVVSLSKFPRNVEDLYSKDGMNVNEYDPYVDDYIDFDFDEWLRITEIDDNRRYEMFAEMCTNKNIMDFGCGNGGTLAKLCKVANKSIGIELDNEARKQIADRGIDVIKSLDDLHGYYNENVRWDIVFSFMCVEHLIEPRKYLKSILDIMDEDTIFICSTPNADDALLSFYDCKSFADFTYWSPHVYLYNEETITRLLEDIGFRVEKCRQVQRYPLSNHLYWLNYGKPGGHIKYQELNDAILDNEYARVLAQRKMCDSIVIYAKKD